MSTAPRARTRTVPPAALAALVALSVGLALALVDHGRAGDDDVLPPPSPQFVPQQRLTDVEISVTPNKARRIGAQTYTVEVTNISATTAENVEIEIQLPPGSRIARNQVPDGCSYSPVEAVLRCDAGELGGGEGEELTFKVFGPARLPAAIPAEVTTSTPDIDYANNFVP